MNNKKQYLLQLLLILGILLSLNVLSEYYHFSLDLTEEKKYTLSNATKRIVADVDDIVYVKVLLEGTFPAGFKRLQNSVKDILQEFRKINPNIEFEFEDPSGGSVEEINERRKALSEQGINPVNLRLFENDERTEKLIYPVAIINKGNRAIPINLLENEIAGASPEENINNSINLIEYKLANGIQKMGVYKKPIIMFSEGHGELDTLETMDLEIAIQSFYTSGRLDINNVVNISPEIGLLIVARPRSAFSDQEKFKIDQYVMNGGKVMFFLEKLDAHIDSISGRPQYVPREYDLNLDDLLFKYGARVNNDLVMDLESTRIPLAVGQMGNRPQLELFPWYYHPAVSARNDHPIVKNLDRIDFRFPNSIDTIKTSTDVDKTILLTSSPYTRYQMSPVQLSFEILRYEPDPSLFDKDPMNLAVLLEGTFPSLYSSRVSESMLEGLNALGLKFKESSVPTSVLVVSDGDIPRNPVNRSTGQFNTLGFNTFEKYRFANKDFMVNAIEYMLDKYGVIEARSKDVKLRLLDTVKAKEEKRKWQLINIGLPLLFLLIFGLIFFWVRKKKYANID